MKSKKIQTRIVLEHINNNFKEYFITILIILIGIIMGIMKINNIDIQSQSQISDDINELIVNVKNNELDKMQILKKSINKNLLMGILLWFLGLAIIGIPIIYGIILYKGYCIGFTMSAIIAVIGKGKGIVLACASLIIHNIILLISMAMIAISGLNVYKSIKKERNRENIKLIILKHSIFSIIPMIGLIIASLTETYISTQLLQIIAKYM